MGVGKLVCSVCCCLLVLVLLGAPLGAPDGDPQWTVYYWGSHKNRGNAVKLLFEYKRVEYRDVSEYDELTKEFAAWNDDVFVSDESDESDGLYHSPVFAPPAIKYHGEHGEHGKEDSGSILLSQTPLLVSFVADKLAILPRTGTIEEYQARKIVLDCFDVSAEVYKLASGNEFRGYSLSNAREYVDRRLEKWLNLLEYPLRDKLYYFGNDMDSIGFADLSVFNLLNGLHQLFDAQLFDILIRKRHPALYALYQNVYNIDSIKAFIDSQDAKGIDWFAKETIVDPIQQALFDAYGIAKNKSKKEL